MIGVAAGLDAGVLAAAATVLLLVVLRLIARLDLIPHGSGEPPRG